MQNYRDTIGSQYASSPSLTQLIQNFNADVAPDDKLNSFYANVWDVLTAVGYGLDCWGRIVGVGRVLTIAEPGDYLGWAEAFPSGQPWTQGVWFGGAVATQNYILSDSAYRILILAKGLANICDGSIRAINQILINLFGQTFGNSYCTDLGHMQMTFTFSNPLDPVSYAVVTQSGVLPVPAGVAFSVVQL